MAQPPAYNRTFSFSNFATANPTTPLPGASVDIELNNAKATLDAINTNIALLQNDDGTVKNASIGLNQLSAAALAGFNPPKAWLTGTAYTASPSSTVFQSSKIYTCLISHTAGTFATDLSNGKWQLILDLTTIPLVNASQIAVSASGLLTTDVQGSLQALDSGKAATSHTHVSTAISDSTADGRAFLTATLASQKTLLGLGSLAFLNSVVVTAITQNLAFTGTISPAALAASTNDWNPTGLSTASVIKCSCTSAFNLTGLQGGTDGRVIFVMNTGATNTLTLTTEDAGSSAANRFSGSLADSAGRVLSGNFALTPKSVAMLVYDGTASRWRVTDKSSLPITAPNIQPFTSGSAATYTTPTDANGNRPLYLRVRMLGGGGGGAARSTNNGNNGTDTSFESWTALHGLGGLQGANTSQGGAGGSGGATGTGTLINRTAGNAGHSTPNIATNGAGGNGGGGPFGGAGLGGEASGTAAGGNAAANSGAGGGGAAGSAGPGGGGGGAGEYVEFMITSPAASYTYTVGAKGTGGPAGGSAGGDGADGKIEVFAHWQ